MFEPLKDILLECTNIPLEIADIVIDMMQPPPMMLSIMQDDLKMLKSIYYFRPELLRNSGMKLYLTAIRYDKREIIKWFDEIKLSTSLKDVRPRLRNI